jgi:putative SOS response-associated peptidase YedK
MGYARTAAIWWCANHEYPQHKIRALAPMAQAGKSLQNPVEGEHQLFGFLTTEPNDVVGAIHPKAMPVILTTTAEIEQWMIAPADKALKLQRV